MLLNKKINQKLFPLNNAGDNKQRLNQGLLRIFNSIVVVLLLAIIIYGCIYTVRLYKSKRNEFYSSATSSILFTVNKCSHVLSNLQTANLTAINAYSSGEEINLSGYKGFEYAAFVYSLETDQSTPVVSNDISSYVPTITNDIVNFLKTNEYISYARFDKNLNYAYYISPLNQQADTFMVVVDKNITEIRDLMTAPIFKDASLFINGIDNNHVFSRNVTEIEIRNWNTIYRQAAFDSASPVDSRQLIEVNDKLVFCHPIYISGYTIGGALDKNNVYAPFVYDILLLLVFSITLIILSIYAILKFRKNIYTPITEIEKVINGITKGDMNLEIVLDESNEFFSMSTQINLMIRHLREILEREYNEKILRKQAQISALQSQINPHFLYNTFDSMRGQALAQGATQVANLLKSLSNLFKYSISQKADTVTLFDELNNVDNYLYIQQYRFNNKFSIEKQIGNDTRNEILSYRMPKLTLQPIVENSLIHGLEPKPDNGILCIRAYTTKHNLIIEIEDNGKGMSPEKLQGFKEHLHHDIDLHEIKQRDSHHTGIGMINVNERIQLLYGKKYGIKLYSTQNIGTTVHILLPLIPT